MNMEEEIASIRENVVNIKDFLKYIMSKDTVTATDRIVYVFQVEKPWLYKEALKTVYHDKNEQPGSEAHESLIGFIKENMEKFELGVINREEKDIDYNIVFQEIFL